MIIPMKPFVLSTFVLLSIFGCRPVQDSSRPYEVFPQDAAYFRSIVNPVGTSSEKSVTVYEDQYPIQLRLYEDGTFHYTLKKLGDGEGTWKYSKADGYIDLYAERTLFVMQMQIRSVAPNDPDAIALEFSDRFGPKYLRLSQTK